MKPAEELDVTVCVCTRNRVQSLTQAVPTILTSLEQSGYCGEVLVVDNGSTDDTAAYVGALKAERPEVRGVVETTPGLSAARNRALREAKGKVVIFTDDDLRQPAGWVRAMAGPILDGTADAVAGRVVIAPELERPWFTKADRYRYAESLDIADGSAVNLIGASMAVSRKAASTIGFEEELGAGRLGGGEDVLFSLRFQREGHHITSQTEVASVHHFDPARLEPAAIRRQVEAVARSEAWIDRHWSGSRGRLPLARLTVASAVVVVLQVGRSLGVTLPPGREHAWLARRAYNRQMLKERKRPGRYI